MTPERWRRAERIFQALLDFDDESRERRLADLCGRDDPQLQSDVRALLASYRQHGFVDELATRLADPSSGPATAAVAPRRIGRYDVIEQIGAGGMGVVYRSRDSQLDRFVAIKLISPARRLDDEWRRRLLVEARATAALDHPCIATVYEIGETEDGTLFLAMAFYEGETLASRLTRGPLPYTDAFRIARDIARALAAAHMRGIVHRDLKPANVLLTAADDVKVVDFGIAQLPGAEETRTGDVLGSLAYMAPEQLRGEKVDARADVWAFGALLSEMLTGERFATGDLRTGGHPGQPPSRPRGDVCRELDAVAERALAARAADRYADGPELLAALDHAQQSRRARLEFDRRFPLPEPITRFFGRLREVDEVRQRLTEARLVTLTGPGGTGKTRLALHIAALVRDRFADGVVFVPLSAIVDPALVSAEIERILSIHHRAAIPPVESLASFLHSRQMLLVLDNFEHLVTAAPDVAFLLTECAHLHILTTSRVPLRLTGEHEYAVPPLPHPSEQSALTATSLEQFPATALFLDRARSVCPTLTAFADEQVRAVADICRRLDGLPLAIELAAARAKLFSPAAMLRRLERPLELLNAGTRDRPARHQSLRHAIAWSYDLLTQHQQTLFRWLGVFVGGCGLEDATRILSARGPEFGDVTDECAALIDQSLVVREDGPDGLPRVRMLDTIREFARERLEETGEADPAHRAHAELYLALAEEAEPHLTRPDQAVWLDRLQIDHDNLRAALSWMQVHGETSMTLRLGAALSRFWLVRGYLREGHQWIARLLAMPGAAQPSLLRARVLNASATLAHEISDFDIARRLVEESLSIAQTLGDRVLAALALNNLAHVLIRVGESETAGKRCEEALALNRDIGDQRGTAVALHNLAVLMELRGDPDRACVLLREDLALRQARGDVRGVAYVEIEIARTEVRRGGLEDASGRLERARATLERLGDDQLLAWALTNQGHLERAAGRKAAALERFATAIELWRTVGNDWGLAFSLVGDAEAALDNGLPERASLNLDEALPLLRRTGVCWGLDDALKARARLAERVGDQRTASAMYEEALALYARMGNPELMRHCRGALERLATTARGPNTSTW
jgi:non-specific serine/threonine protein kinase